MFMLFFFILLHLPIFIYKGSWLYGEFKFDKCKVKKVGGLFVTQFGLRGKILL